MDFISWEKSIRCNILLHTIPKSLSLFSMSVKDMTHKGISEIYDNAFEIKLFFSQK